MSYPNYLKRSCPNCRQTDSFLATLSISTKGVRRFKIKLNVLFLCHFCCHGWHGIYIKNEWKEDVNKFVETNRKAGFLLQLGEVK